MPLLPEYYVYAGLFLSGLIAVAVTYVFRGVAVSNAEQILAEGKFKFKGRKRYESFKRVGNRVVEKLILQKP